MTADELKAYKRTSPFRPFRIVLEGGKAYDIPHPNFIWVLERTAHVGTRGDVREGLWDRYEIVELGQIMTAEPIGHAASSSN